MPNNRSDCHECKHHNFFHKNKKLLGISFFITGIMMLGELSGGIYTGSMALVSDAAHMTVDSAALGCAYWAAKIAQKNKQAEILAAFINGRILILISFVIAASSWQRFCHPRTILSQEMVLIATTGFFVNFILFFVLSRGDRQNINMQGAIFHVICDGIMSIFVILGGLSIKYIDYLGACSKSLGINPTIEQIKQYFGFYTVYQIDSALGIIFAPVIFAIGTRLTINFLRKFNSINRIK